MFFAIDVNGQTTIVSTDSKPAANAFAQTLVQQPVVRAATKADFDSTGTSLADVPEILKGGKTQAMLDAEAQAKADKEAKKAAKAAATPAA